MLLNGYEVERFPALDLDGSLVGLVIAKATWVYGEDRILRLAEPPEPVLFVDILESGEDPTESAVKFEADTALIKRECDLVVVGAAYAPNGEPARFFDVEVTFGSFRRALRIFGPRRAIYRGPSEPRQGGPPPRFTEPEPVRRVPMSYRYAYGGVARYRLPNSDEVIEIPCPTNPFGKGYCVQNSPEGVDGLELPQIEDPSALLTPETLVREIGSPEKVPWPAGFGFYGRGWYPRVAFAGVMPYEMEKVKAQVREQAKALAPDKDQVTIEMLENFEPPIMDVRFYQGAAPGMTIHYPRGDESVAIRNMTPSGYVAFNLPGRRPLVRLDVGKGLEPVPMVLDTVVILPDEMRLMLTFRGRIALGGPDMAESFAAAPLELMDLSVHDYEEALSRLGALKEG